MKKKLFLLLTFVMLFSAMISLLTKVNAATVSYRATTALDETAMAEGYLVYNDFAYAERFVIEFGDGLEITEANGVFNFKGYTENVYRYNLYIYSNDGTTQTVKWFAASLDQTDSRIVKKMDANGIFEYHGNLSEAKDKPVTLIGKTITKIEIEFYVNEGTTGHFQLLGFEFDADGSYSDFRGLYGVEDEPETPVVPEGPLYGDLYTKSKVATVVKNAKGEDVVTYNASNGYDTFRVEVSNYNVAYHTLEVYFTLSESTRVCFEVNGNIDWSIGHKEYAAGLHKFSYNVTSYKLPENFIIAIYLDAEVAVNNEKTVTFHSIEFTNDMVGDINANKKASFSLNENLEQVISYNTSPGFTDFVVNVGGYDAKYSQFVFEFSSDTDTQVFYKFNGVEDWGIGYVTYEGGKRHTVTIDVTSKNLPSDFTIAFLFDAGVTVDQEKSITIHKIDFVDPNSPSVCFEQLLSKYYNNGTYVRDTEIFLNEEAVKEATAYFHAQCTILRRTTYFAPTELWMSTENNASGNMVYSYYGSADGNLTWTHTTSAKVSPLSTSVAIKGTSMEDYYTTLKDVLALSSLNWEYADGVFASTDAKAIQAFLDFAAPCFLNLNKENANYLTLVKVTVEETEAGLVLKLWTSGDEGKLSGEANLFAQAVITNEAALEEIKLSAPTNVKYENNTLSFDSVEHATFYNVVISKNGNEVAELTTESTSLDLTELELLGSYSVMVYACNEETVSEEAGSHSFDVLSTVIDVVLEAEVHLSDYANMYRGNDKAHGGAYVGNINNCGQGITLYYFCYVAGEYDFEAHYMTGMPGSFHNVYVNGVKQARLDYSENTGWGTADAINTAKATAKVTLNLGWNSIVVIKDGTSSDADWGGYAELDYFVVKGNSSTYNIDDFADYDLVAPTTYRLEGEQAGFIARGGNGDWYYSHLTPFQCTPASSNYMIGGIDNHGQGLEWHLRANKAGKYRVTISFAHVYAQDAIKVSFYHSATTLRGQAMSLESLQEQYLVNVLPLDAGQGWGVPVTNSVTFEMDLVEGDNFIYAIKEHNDYFQVDYIELTLIG